MRARFRHACAALLVWLAPALALAQDGKPAAATQPASWESLGVATCPEQVTPATFQDDRRLVDHAWQAFVTTGFAGIRIHVPFLQQVLDHAPQCFPAIERRGDAILIRRTDDNADYGPLTLMLLAHAASAGESLTVGTESNVYIRASLILGAYANEMRQFEEALSYLDRGLALQPRAFFLVNEKSMALSQLGRREEAHALLRGELDSSIVNLELDRARFERMDGVTLIDLGRLDEAEAALNESIRLQPNNPTARSELRYIAQLRAGQTPENSRMIAPDAPQPQTQ
jgi:tetratricopeptide (TPR) repeat protein